MKINAEKVSDAESDSKEETNQTDEYSMHVLEDALDAAKFGRFHLRLMVAVFTGAVATVLVHASTSFIVTAAECDLNMTFRQKGWLMSAAYFGQVVSAIFTGFLGNVYGRRKLVLIGCLFLVVSRLIEGSSQTFTMLYVMKVIEGFLYAVPLVSMPIMLSEFTSLRHRNICLILYTSFSSSTNIIIALMAWGIIPNTWHIIIIKDYFELKSWNILIYSCSIWCLLTFIQFYYLPESPKFLYAHGRCDEALDAIKVAYTENTGRDPSTFPIKCLRPTGLSQNKSLTLKQKVATSFKSMKVLIKPLYLRRLIVFSLWSILFFNNSTSFKNWYPQLVTIVENYKHENSKTESLCLMVDNHLNRTVTTNELIYDAEDILEEECIPLVSGRETYLSSIMMGCACVGSVILNAFLVKYINPLWLLFANTGLCCFLSISLYWVNTLFQISLVMSLMIACLMAAQAIFAANVLRAFPTHVRSFAQSTTLIFVRIGSTSGNILLPVLLENNCYIPLIIMSVSTGVIAAGVFFFPDLAKDNKKSGDM